jgi:hypothetical protein
MTQEDKAKRYDEAIEKAKNCLKDGTITNIAISYIETIFPELQESDDEKIRKELLEHCKNQAKPYIQTGNKCPQIQSWIAWLDNQGDKDKLIKELGAYKVKYTQEVLSNHPYIMNKDDERLRNTTIAFLKDFADKGYENAVECIDWLEKQGECEIDCPQNHRDNNRPNGCIVLEDFNGGEGFYKLHLDYLNKKQVEEVEEMVKIWNDGLNASNENIKACIGMCLTDVNEQRFKDYGTNLKECLAWLEKQGEKIIPKNVDEAALQYVDTCSVNGEITHDNITEPYWNNHSMMNAYKAGWLEKQKQDPCDNCKDVMLNCHNFPCIKKSAFEQGKSAFEVINEEDVDNANKVENFGGAIPDEEWENDSWKYVIYRDVCSINTTFVKHNYYFLAFHTAEQRNLFLEKYRDLVKDYLMID